MLRATTSPAAPGCCCCNASRRRRASSSTRRPMLLGSPRRTARRRLRARQVSRCSADMGERSASPSPARACSTQPSWKRNCRGRTSPEAINSWGSTQRSGAITRCWLPSSSTNFWLAAQNPSWSARKGVPVSPRRRRVPSLSCSKVTPQPLWSGNWGSSPRWCTSSATTSQPCRGQRLPRVWRSSSGSRLAPW